MLALIEFLRKIKDMMNSYFNYLGRHFSILFSA